MHTELNTYKSNIDKTLPDLIYLRDTTATIGRFVGYGKIVAGKLKDADKTADKAASTIDVTQVILGVLGFVSPLKAPVKVLEKVLKTAEKPVDKIDEKFDELDGKDDKSTPEKEEDGKFLENLETNLGSAGLKIAVAQDAMTLKIWQLETVTKALAEFQVVMPVALRSGEDWSGKYDALNLAVEAQLATRNALYTPLVEFYEDVKSRVDAFLSNLDLIDFQKIFGEFVDLDALKGIFDFLEKPLEIAESLIAPIQPLLNAINFLVSLVVDPIIDFVTNSLGIDKLLDKVSDQIEKLLPSIDVLDQFVALAQDLQDFLLEYIDDFMNSIDYLDEIETAFFGNNVGEADDGKGPTGWDDDLINILEGDGGDDVLAGLDGKDTIRGFGGDDVIIGGTGSDFLDGGAGDDLFYFDASFTEYELSRDPDTGNIIVSHLRPSDPEKSTGVDVLAALDDHDNVVFTDISFTGEELNNAIIGPSILNGNNDDNLMFLNSQGVLVNGFHQANGFGGDDRIFGSVENDQLNGGSGNDIFLPGLGNDEVNGDSGSDTFQVLEGANREFQVDLLDGTANGQGQDTLNSIENIILAPDQNHEVEGNAADNYISTGDEIDVISGREGDDTIDAGEEDDYIVGGQGADVIDAGEGRNAMISGSVAVAGVSDLYIGSADNSPGNQDLVSYTSRSNTIQFDFNDQSDDPAILQALKNFMADVPDSGPVEIDAATGEIKRFDMQGNFVTTDFTRDVEAYMGSDMADMIFGDPNAEWLHGAGGDDTIHTGGTENINGGLGSDLILVENVDGGSKALQINGGGGDIDTLDLRGVGDARWYYKLEGSIVLQLKAFATTVEGRNLQNAFNSTFSIKPRDIEQILFSDYADHISYRPGGSGRAEFFLYDGDDYFQALNGNPEVFGGNGNDLAQFSTEGVFHGEAGDDRAEFNASGDEHEANMGADRDFLEVTRMNGHADGGSDYDSILFNRANTRMVVDLVAGTAQGVQVSGTQFGSIDITLENFEEFILTEFNDFLQGTGADEQIIARGGNDTILAGNGRDKIFGGAGHDSIEGGKGDDLIHGGLGDDTINGGAGRDAVSYDWVRPGGEEGETFAGTFGGATVDLAAGTAAGIVGDVFGTDTLISIENVFGSGADDILRGTDFANTISGNRGDDQLYGRGGDDILITGSGGDFVDAGAGNDTVVVGIGNKNLMGGDGVDVLDFGTVRGVVTIDFESGGYFATFKDQTPVWSNLDTDGDGIDDSDGTEARLFNGSFLTPQDVLETDPRFSNNNADTTRVLPDEADPLFENFQVKLIDADVNSGGLFSDFEKVVGGESGARIILTSGFDRFDGRVSSRDVIDLSASTDQVTFNFQTGLNNVALLVGDDVTGIEGIAGGQMNDALTGDERANILSGGAGKDVIKGSSGEDEIQGDDGEDFLRGGSDNDVARGGDDDDKVYGDGGDDTLYGDAGADLVVGDVGDDMLDGGEGDDTLAPGEGRDTVDGGDGVDVVRFERSVDLFLASGIAKVDGEKKTLLNIENAEGSSQDDMLAGDSAANMLSGSGGNDTIVSNDGEDTLMGGSGEDSLKGGDDAQQFDGGDGADKIEGANGNDTAHGGKGNDDIYGNADDDLLMGDGGKDTISGGKGNDTVEGGSGKDHLFGDKGLDSLDGGEANDFLSGGDGNDTLRPGTGEDTVDGGAGEDVVLYDEAVQLYLKSGQAFVGGVEEVVINVEHATGSGGDDRLVGDDGANRLNGSDGNDLLISKDGADTLKGGAGEDKLKGGNDAQALFGGTGNDTISGNGGNDTAKGGDGDDRIFGNGDDDRLEGEAGNDKIDGGKGNDRLEGGAGVDTLEGGRGDDYLLGGDDQDFIFGENGEDVLIGGKGDDRLTGGGQADVFVLELGGGFDRIKDFEDGLDRVDVSDLGVLDMTQLQALAVDQATGARIDFVSGEQVFMDGMFKADLTSDDFIFAT